MDPPIIRITFLRRDLRAQYVESQFVDLESLYHEILFDFFMSSIL